LKLVPTNFDAMSSANPWGGVINPNARVTINTTPICTGLMSAESVSAFTTGMKMMMAGITKINMTLTGSVPATPPIQPATTIGPRG
jgi:hypothetical protein